MEGQETGRERPHEEPLHVEKAELPAPRPRESREQRGVRRTALRHPLGKGDKVLRAARGGGAESRDTFRGP